MKTTIQEAFTEFEARCLLNAWARHCDPEKVQRLWAEADSREAFVKSLQEDEDLRFGQACGILSRGDFYFIRGMVGDRQFKTVSDAGSVRIRNDGFSVLIPNGYGDGESRVAVFEPGEEFNTDALAFWSVVDGEFDICSSDCSDVVARHLCGRFAVYYGESFVVFIRT